MLQVAPSQSLPRKNRRDHFLMPPLEHADGIFIHWSFANFYLFVVLLVVWLRRVAPNSFHHSTPRLRSAFSPKQLLRPAFHDTSKANSSVGSLWIVALPQPSHRPRGEAAFGGGEEQTVKRNNTQQIGILATSRVFRMMFVICFRFILLNFANDLQ